MAGRDSWTSPVNALLDGVENIGGADTDAPETEYGSPWARALREIMERQTGVSADDLLYGAPYQSSPPPFGDRSRATTSAWTFATTTRAKVGRCRSRSCSCTMTTRRRRASTTSGRPRSANTTASAWCLPPARASSLLDNDDHRDSQIEMPPVGKIHSLVGLLKYQNIPDWMTHLSPCRTRVAVNAPEAVSAPERVPLPLTLAKFPRISGSSTSSFNFCASAE